MLLSFTPLLYWLTDIDECSSGTHNCAHRCHNNVGSFTCSCYSGYRLSSNGCECNGRLNYYSHCCVGTEANKCMLYVYAFVRRYVSNWTVLAVYTQSCAHNYCEYQRQNYITCTSWLVVGCSKQQSKPVCYRRKRTIKTRDHARCSCCHTMVKKNIEVCS